MIERELVAIIKSHRQNALGGDDGALSSERAEALDRYHGRPYGNEDEGRSAVVSRDLSETVDWAMPAIMRVFTQSGNIGEFDPVGPEDEELAQQESDAVNHVVMKQNDGFILLHDVIKDALLLKNGYAKHWWEVTEKVTEEEYSGMTMEQIAGMVASLQYDGTEVEVKGQESKRVTVETPMGPQEIEVFDVKLQIKKKCGRVRVVAVPCEEVRVSRKCRGTLQEAPFVEHVTRKTRSELIEMGMKRSFVDSVPALAESKYKSEELARDSVDDESDDLEAALVDRSMDEVEYCEAFLRVDWDGDGIAELRKVVTVSDRIPPGDEWNERIEACPITGGVPKRVPHRHVGESLWDELADLQEIKTVLFRQALDNLYLTNNSQWIVNERVNMPDFMQSLPGGIKRVRGVDPIGDSVQPVTAQPVLNQVLPAIDYVDSIKQKRTGISESTTGLDPDILKQSTKGAFLENLNRASQKIEMITRMLAETFVKPMLLEVHGLMIRHQDKPMTMKLRGKYVTVDPRSWKDRTDLTLRVGIGTGNEEEKREKLMIAAQVQEKTAMLGLVGPEEGYNLATDLYKSLGFDMPDKYVINPDPGNPKWQQQQQQKRGQKDPLVQAEEVKANASLQKAQMDSQANAQQAQIDAQMERDRMAMENAYKEREAQRQVELEKWKAELKAQTDITIAQIKAQIDTQIEAVRSESAVKSARLGNPSYREDQAQLENTMLSEIASRLDGLGQGLSQVAQLAAQAASPKVIVGGGDGGAMGVRPANAGEIQ